MKKIITLSLLITLSACSFAGCQTENTPTSIGKKINKNLNTLYSTVTTLDSIDNSYIANPDIYSLENVENLNYVKKNINLPNNQNNEGIIKSENIPTNRNHIIKKINLIKNDFNNEIKKNETLLIENKEEKIIDNKSLIDNKKETSKENIDIFEKNNKNDINNKSIDENKIIETNINEKETISEEKNSIENTKPKEDKIEIITEDEVKKETNSNETLILNNDGNAEFIDEKGTKKNHEIPQEKLDKIFNDTIKDDSLSKEKKDKIYVFLFDKIKYVPRYANNYNTKNAQTTLNSYLTKVQELYTMTSDVIEANNILKDEKNELILCIDNLKKINDKMIKGEIIPNNQQLIALNNYVMDIKNTIKRIKLTNGQLNNEVNNISTSSSNYGLTKSVDIINSNYLKILNHIDARITYFKSAIATLNQIDYILHEASLELNYDINNDEIKNIESNKNEQNFNSKSNIEKDKNKQSTNIDSFKQNKQNENKNNDNSKKSSNIDSFKANIKKENIEINNNVDDNISNIYDNNPNIIDNNNNINDTNIVNNNSLINNSLPNNKDINTPNGTFQNGIITQNNLNNGVNNGVNGNLSGYANGNGNVDYFKQNNLNRTDKNVNTYGRNTLVDMINNGTVNNGINTL